MTTAGLLPATNRAKAYPNARLTSEVSWDPTSPRTSYALTNEVSLESSVSEAAALRSAVSVAAPVGSPTDDSLSCAFPGLVAWSGAARRPVGVFAAAGQREPSGHRIRQNTTCDRRWLLAAGSTQRRVRSPSVPREQDKHSYSTSKKAAPRVTAADPQVFRRRRSRFRSVTDDSGFRRPQHP